MLTNIQRLRALAAIYVVIFHTNAIGAKYGYASNWLFELQPWSPVGVDVFFVISGFIMVHIQQRKRSAPLAFMFERFFRIAPLYWLLTSLLLVLFICAPALFNSSDLDMSWVISSFAFMSQAYTGNMPLLYDGWSLEYEMLFYCVFSMALLIKRLDGTVLAAASAMLLFGLVSGHMIVMEFIYGMLLGLIKQRYTKPPVAPLFALLIGLVCIYFAGIRALYGDEYRAWSFGLPAMLVVFWGIYDKQWPADALSKLGDASYSIYLVQVFTVSGWYKLATKLDVPHWDFVLGAGCVVGTVILGIFIHSYVEKPLTLLLLPLKSWIHAKVQPSLSR